MPATLGFLPHTGWSVAVALAGDVAAPALVDRRRIELCDPGLPAPAYHAAKDLPLAQARSLVDRVVEAAHRQAAAAVAELVAELGRAGHRVVAAALPTGGTTVPTDLERVLASHALLHAAEGQLYRDALLEASAEAGLNGSMMPRRDLPALVQQAAGLDGDSLHQALTDLGRSCGPPWRKDHREAAMAAWLALATVAHR